mgnify:CR=1 FL=1
MISDDLSPSQRLLSNWPIRVVELAGGSWSGDSHFAKPLAEVGVKATIHILCEK